MPEPIVSLNEETLRADLRELVRRTVEEMLNGLLDEEADDCVSSTPFEQNEHLNLSRPRTDRAHRF